MLFRGFSLRRSSWTSDNTINGTSSGDSEGNTQPGFVSKLPPKRRKVIIAALRKAIPKIAHDRRKVLKENAAYCRLCILDAFQGRLSNGLANNSQKPPWVYTVFCIQTSDWLFNSVVWACVFHTLSIFFEPENACSNSTIYFMIQALVLSIYTFDISLKMSYEGPKEYWKHDWQQLYLIVCALGWLDLMFNHCTYYTNPLRPVAGFLRARRSRRFFEVLKKMIPGMSHSLMPLLFFIVLVMVLSILMYDQTIKELADPAYTSYNWFFLIFTNDNFNRVLPDVGVKDMKYLMFFFPCIYVGQQFLLSLIIGDTYETYKSFVKKQLKKEKLKEMQGLTKAFSAMDDEKSGTISKMVWHEILRHYDPEMPEEAIACYFELIGGGSSQISVLQFLSLRSVLNFHLHVRSSKTNIITGLYKPVLEAAASAYQVVTLPTPAAVQGLGKKMLEYLASLRLFHRANYLDLLALCFAFSDYPILPLGAVLFPTSPAFSSSNAAVLTAGSLLTLGCLVEFQVRLMACGGKIHLLHEKNNTISWVYVVGAAGTCACLVLKYAYGFDGANVLAITIPYVDITVGTSFGKLALTAQALRCMRIINLNKDLQNFSMAVFDVAPALFECFTFTFIITYIFGALGNLLFGQFMEEWQTPLLAVVKAQQLTFMVDFLSSTESTMDLVHPAAALFFVFYLILSLAVSNIALSIIIELQTNILAGQTSKDRDAQTSKIDIMFNKIKGQARARAVMEGKNILLSHIEMSPFQSSDTRHFIADMDGEKEAKLEEIKQCKKYSNIDLVGHFQQEHRHHKDMHWEVGFLATAREEGLSEKTNVEVGAVLFEAGSSANQIYMVITGCVTLTQPMSQGFATIHQGHFVGQEALHPSATYDYTCTSASSDCCVLVITHEDMAEKLDSDICGIILRMSHKSHQKIVSSMLDARRRASRMSSMSLSVDVNQMREKHSLKPEASENSPNHPTGRSSSPFSDSETNKNDNNDGGADNSNSTSTSSSTWTTVRTPTVAPSAAPKTRGLWGNKKKVTLSPVQETRRSLGDSSRSSHDSITELDDDNNNSSSSSSSTAAAVVTPSSAPLHQGLTALNQARKMLRNRKMRTLGLQHDEAEGKKNTSNCGNNGGGCQSPTVSSFVSTTTSREQEICHEM
mmetsp:Transcript_1591/g.2628  ORF Transcript_1591/g.2628 Transcript_1591/m.2628 type:complete len:1144 (+) Transcript_1591:16-3447(+)